MTNYEVYLHDSYNSKDIYIRPKEDEQVAYGEIQYFSIRGSNGLMSSFGLPKNEMRSILKQLVTLFNESRENKG